jgi:hypothetical protein
VDPPGEIEADRGPAHPATDARAPEAGEKEILMTLVDGITYFLLVVVCGLIVLTELCELRWKKVATRYRKRIDDLEGQLSRCMEDRIRLSNEIGNLRIRIHREADR